MYREAEKKVIGRPFQKGQSGNPSGRSKDTHKISQLAKAYTEEAIEKLAEIMRTGKTEQEPVRQLARPERGLAVGAVVFANLPFCRLAAVASAWHRLGGILLHDQFWRRDHGRDDCRALRRRLRARPGVASSRGASH
jgi:Family of unknown function (DUF5681)